MSEATQWFYKSKEILKPIIETQMIGLARGLIGLPIDHLFDRFKTLVQASLSNNFRQLVIESYTTNGLFKGVFAGFSSQLGIQMFKQYYRWPMMIFIPKIYLEHMPQKVKEMAPALHKGLTGVTIALFESIVTCPMERIKCQLMTQKISKSVIKSMWTHDGSLTAFTRDLFTGIEIMALKQVVSWTNYLYWDHRVRYYFKEKPSSKLTYQEIGMCAVMSAIPNILIVQPFDTIKTQYQMENNQNIKDLSIWKAFKKVYKMNGFIGLYAGWQMKMCQFTFSALLTTPVMDYLERQHGISVM